MRSKGTTEIGRRLALLLAAIMGTLVLSCGVALALNQINCANIQQYPQTPGCYGTDQEDQIEGQDVRDIIYADGGDDRVNANYGNDEAYGAAGTDTLDGGGDDDKLYGGANADLLSDSGPYIDTDELRGGGGNDALDAYD